MLIVFLCLIMNGKHINLKRDNIYFTGFMA